MQTKLRTTRDASSLQPIKTRNAALDPQVKFRPASRSFNVSAALKELSDVFRDAARPGDDPVMTTVSPESLGALLVSASRFVCRVPTLAVE
jgi:hypothetical protein